MEVTGQLYASVDLHQVKNAGIHFTRKLGRLQSWCGRFEEHNSLVPSGIWITYRPARGLVIIDWIKNNISYLTYVYVLRNVSLH